MRFQKQTIEGDQDQGINGDCYRAALATLLDLDIASVPHFYEEVNDDRGSVNNERTTDWALTVDKWITQWLADRGVVRIRTMIDGRVADVNDVFETASACSGGLPLLLSGANKNNQSHVVIVEGSRIIWDPSKHNTGIVGPAPHAGIYLVEILVHPLLSIKTRL